MLLMGDEVQRTQRGNNNAYCQDNEMSWFDWGGVERHAGLLRFVQGLIHFTQAREIFREERFWTATEGGQEPHITWHGVRLEQPDWGHDSHTLAFTLCHPEGGDHLHVMLNAYWEPLAFELPPLPARERWHRIVDTALLAPDDFSDPEAAPTINGDRYQVGARSAVVLMAQGS